MSKTDRIIAVTFIIVTTLALVLGVAMFIGYVTITPIP